MFVYLNISSLRFLLIVYIFFLKHQDLSNLIRGRPCKGVKNLIKLKTICLCHHYTWGEQHFRKNIGILKTIRISMEVSFGYFFTCSRKKLIFAKTNTAVPTLVITRTKVNLQQVLTRIYYASTQCKIENFY